MNKKGYFKFCFRNILIKTSIFLKLKPYYKFNFTILTVDKICIISYDFSN